MEEKVSLESLVEFPVCRMCRRKNPRRKTNTMLKVCHRSAITGTASPFTKAAAKAPAKPTTPCPPLHIFLKASHHICATKKPNKNIPTRPVPMSTGKNELCACVAIPSLIIRTRPNPCPRMGRCRNFCHKCSQRKVLPVAEAISSAAL